MDMRIEKRVIKQTLPLVWPYLLLFVIVLILFASGLLVSQRVATRNAEQTAENRIEVISDEVIKRISSYRKACDVLATSNAILTFPQEAGDEVSTMQSAVNTAQQALSNVMSIVSFPYSDVEVYYPQKEVIVSIRRDYRGQEECLTQIESQAGGDVLWNTLQGMDSNSAWAMCDSGGKGWLIRQLMGREGAIAYIIMEYEFSQLVPMNEEEGITFVGSGTSLQYSSVDDIQEETFQTIREQVQREHRFRYNGEEYVAYRCIFSVFGLEITIAVSVDEIIKNTSSIQKALILLAGICFACSFVIYRIMYKRVILPYHYLAEETWEDEGADSPQDVLTQARAKLLAMKTQQDASDEERKLLIPLGVGDLLQRMLTGPMEMRADVAKRCLSLAGVLPGKRYLVFAINGEQDDAVKSDYLDSPQTVLERVLQESLLSSRVGVIAVVERYLVIVASCLEADTEEKLAEVLQQAAKRCKETSGVTMAATRPFIGSTPEEFRNIVRRTMNDVTYLYFWHKEHIDDTPPGHETRDELVSFIKAMRNLINRLDNRDYAGAQTAFAHIIEKNLPKSADEFQITKFRVYGMMEMLIAAISEQTNGGEAVFENLDYEKRLSGIDTIHGFYSTTKDIFSELIEFRQKCDQTDSGIHRIENIKAYLDTHYAENSLTVTAVAEHFNLSGPYISREFKRMAGCNMLEYIQKLRIERVKKLLETCSVKDAAQQAGFCDSQGLVRVFKKYEGITPGEYKKSLQQ